MSILRDVLIELNHLYLGVDPILEEHLDNFFLTPRKEYIVTLLFIRTVEVWSYIREGGDGIIPDGSKKRFIKDYIKHMDELDDDNVVKFRRHINGPRTIVSFREAIQQGDVK